MTMGGQADQPHEGQRQQVDDLLLRVPWPAQAVVARKVGEGKHAGQSCQNCGDARRQPL